jgi:Tfp pilus assembly PilM family ATPase
MTSSSALVGESFFGIDLKKIQTRWTRFRRRVSKRILLMDFDATSITLAEAQIQSEALTYSHVRRYPLPEEALERGVPAEPAKMAALIRGYCQEADIPAHRAAVVLPHDAVFTTVVQLPRSVPPAMALEHALDPASALQVPIQLDQMDVDLMPLALPSDTGDQRSYFLTAVPRKLVDRVLDTLQAADLEMVRLQVGVFAQLQHLADLLNNLASNAALLHLELLRDCTQATVLTQCGPIKLARLTAIRDFPEPPEAAEGAAAASALNAEAQIIASDAYLPISDLDLRRLNQEIRQFTEEFQAQYPPLALTGVALAGVNSAHPLLASLLQDALELPVQVSRPLATPGVGQFIPDGPMVLQGLGRLVGLGLSLTPASAGAVLEQQVDASSPPVVETVVERVLQPSLLSAEATEAGADLSELPMLKTLQLDQVQEEDPEPEFLDAPALIGELKLSLDSEPELQRPEQEPQPSEPELEPLDAPIFSIASVEAEPAAGQPDPVLLAPEPPADEVPFSLGDLLSSYQAKTSESEVPLLDEPPVVEAEPFAELEPEPQPELSVFDADVHLVDDPSLWPSITKAQPDLDGDPVDAGDSISRD